MPRFAANLSMMYPDLPFLDRFEAAAKDGFTAVEYLFPYAFAKEELVERLQANNLQQVLFNAPPGGTDAASIDRAWNGGDKGITCIPGREDEFRAGVALALDYAQALGCPRIHLMAGLLPAGVSREAAQRTYVANLRWAAAEAARHGRDVLIEPINTRDIPGFFLNRQDQAHALVAEVGASNIKVQMDLYHCQIVEGDVAIKIRQYLPTGKRWPLPDRRRARAPRARHRRSQLPLPVRRDRRGGRPMRLGRLDRLRVQAQTRRPAGRDVRRAGLVWRV
jgi:hydroxypyruvate isomerase